MVWVCKRIIVEEFEEAVRLFSSVVDEIQLTELDIQSSWNYDGSNVQEEWQKSADRYREIYNKIYELDAEEGINITGITNWGTHDEVSWLNDMSNVGGGADGSRPQCPLLFDNDLQAKPAYYAITGQMELFPTIKSKAILYSKDGSFTSASEKMNIGNAGIFQTVWNESGLQVQVRVSDSNITQDDKVIVYVDPTNSRTDGVTPVKYEVKATDAKKVDGGYEVTVTLPTDQLAINSAFGFDVAIVNDGVMTSWNDTTNNQETSSKFYGLLKCKPFLTIEKGTVTVDGDEDDIWASVEEVPLTIKTSNVNASATVKTLWDEENLYVYAKVEDNDLNDSNVLPYEQDSFEIFVDQNNAKTSSYQTDDCQYRISYKNNVSINALDGGNTDYSKAIKSETKLTETGYVVETSIKWTDIKPNNNTAVGLEFQINDASSQGVRIGTASWNDETGLGYCNTSVYGTALLVDSSDDGNNSGSDSENNGSNGGSNSGNGGSTNGGVTGESTKPETDNSDNNGSNGGSNTESGNTTEDNKKPVSVGTVVKRVNANYKVTEVKDGKCNLIFSNTALKPVTASIASTVTINGVKYPVTEIAKNTFKNSKTLKEVSIGKNVAVVNNDAFRNCTSLTTIRGLESVETFGKNAFRGCKKLKTVTLGKNVTSIGTYAFADNASLKTITINSDKLTKVGKNAFKNVNKDVTIKVPKKQLDEYKKLLKNAGLPKTAKIVGYTVK